jgi:hypothetical protein
LTRETAKFEKSVDKAGPDAREWYEDSHGEFVMEVSDQMRFLRNMSLVALLDRLLQTLSTMAKSGMACYYSCAALRLAMNKRPVRSKRRSASFCGITGTN